MAGAVDAPNASAGYISLGSFSGPVEETSSQMLEVEKRRWQEDTVKCSICQSKFGDVLKRRHHCRTCGKCVCHDCSPNTLQIKGKLERVCSPCVSNGAGAIELLPALHYVRQELCNLNMSPLDSSGFSSLPPANHPAQAVAECVAAVDPLRRIFTSMSEEGEKRCQTSVTAEVEAAQRERRARALADTCKSTVDERMALSKELAQERKSRQDLEDKLGELTQGLCQLDRMLKDLKESDSPAKCEDDTASDESSRGEKINSVQHLKQMERALASCTLSAGVWLGRRRGSTTCSSSSPVPVLSRALTGSRASTMTPCSSDSLSGDGESEESDGESRPPANTW